MEDNSNNFGHWNRKLPSFFLSFFLLFHNCDRTTLAGPASMTQKLREKKKQEKKSFLKFLPKCWSFSWRWKFSRKSWRGTEKLNWSGKKLSSFAVVVVCLFFSLFLPSFFFSLNWLPVYHFCYVMGSVLRVRNSTQKTHYYNYYHHCCCCWWWWWW